MAEPAAPSFPPGRNSKRVRSLPDRPGSLRPAGGVRSLPMRGSGSPRLLSMDTANFGLEKSWARGLGILWTLFVLAMLLEALNAAFYLLAGKVAWPPDSQIVLGGTRLVLPLDAGRLALVCTCFAALWAGWSWLRYPLAAVDFLSGLWLVVGMIASAQSAPQFRATHVADVPIYSRIESLPKMALGILYLATAAYVVFSIDVKEFIAHRRTRGRVWSALLVALFAYGWMALLLVAQPIYNSWLHVQRLSAMAFGEDTLRKMANGWTPDCIDDRIDPDFAKSFTPDGRRATFANFKELGPLLDAHTAPLAVVTTVQPNPLQNIVPAPADIATGVTRDENGFRVLSRYNTTGAKFEHGQVRFGLDLVRDLFGSWRVMGIDAVPVRIDPPRRAQTAPSPDATALPTPTPAAATPVPSTGG